MDARRRRRARAGRGLAARQLPRLRREPGLAHRLRFDFRFLQARRRRLPGSQRRRRDRFRRRTSRARRAAVVRRARGGGRCRRAARVRDVGAGSADGPAKAGHYGRWSAKASVERNERRDDFHRRPGAGASWCQPRDDRGDRAQAGRRARFGIHIGWSSRRRGGRRRRRSFERGDHAGGTLAVRLGSEERHDRQGRVRCEGVLVGKGRHGSLGSRVVGSGARSNRRCRAPRRRSADGHRRRSRQGAGRVASTEGHWKPRLETRLIVCKRA